MLSATRLLSDLFCSRCSGCQWNTASSTRQPFSHTKSYRRPTYSP